MADFAATDRRSVKAHLKGTSLRAKSFTAFTTIAKALGRGDRAADDFKATSRYFFKRRDAIRAFGQKVGRFATAGVGLAAGVALYIVFVLQ
jgi:hypothetical protein